MLGPPSQALLPYGNRFNPKVENDDLDIQDNEPPPTEWLITGGAVMPIPTGLPPSRAIVFSGANARYI